MILVPRILSLNKYFALSLFNSCQLSVVVLLQIITFEFFPSHGPLGLQSAEQTAFLWRSELVVSHHPIHVFDILPSDHPIKCFLFLLSEGGARCVHEHSSTLFPIMIG